MYDVIRLVGGVRGDRNSIVAVQNEVGDVEEGFRGFSHGNTVYEHSEHDVIGIVAVPTDDSVRKSQIVRRRKHDGVLVDGFAAGPVVRRHDNGVTAAACDERRYVERIVGERPSDDRSVHGHGVQPVGFAVPAHENFARRLFYADGKPVFRSACRRPRRGGCRRVCRKEKDTHAQQCDETYGKTFERSRFHRL